MIVTKGRGNNVIVRHRAEDGTRKETIVSTYKPYFFVSTSDADLVYATRKEDGYRCIYGTKLTKIEVADAGNIYDFKKQNPNIMTWEANVPFVNRVLTDRVRNGDEPFKQYEHRTWYLDCEWSPTTKKMRVIVVYDSFTDSEYVWFVDKNLEETTKFDKYGEYTYDVPAIGFPSEREMLAHFLKHMDRQDPDIITGWFVVGADIKTIIERCRAVGIQPTTMSPHRRLTYSYRDWEQPIVGRNCIDLMLAFPKLWELKNGKLPSKKLDDVAFEALGEKKIELPDGHDTYLTDLPLYIHYCRQDVRLLPKLDSKVNALDYFTSLQHIVQCDIRSTPFITKMFTCLVLADKENEGRIPTNPLFLYEPYEGADVMEVDAGLYNNVGILDIKAMYHSNAALHNISWETLYEIDPLTKEITDKHDLYLGALSDVDDFADCGNGTLFTQGKRGLLVRQMDYMTTLRNKFKKLMKNDPLNYDRWDAMQYACKSLVASMYGVAGDSKYGLYHPAVAAAITYTSRTTLNRLKTIAEEGGNKVIYGHTDSVFCEIGSPARGEALIRSINDEMKPIEVEFEKWCPSMVLMAKNRYAGRVAWTDGKTHEPTLYVKGIELKQSRMPPIMKQVMTNTLEMILANKEEEEVNEMLIPIIDSIVNEEVSIDDLAMKGKLERNLSEYKVLSGPSAGAAWANEYLGKGYRSGSYFKVILNKEGKYMAFDNPSDLDGIALVGYKIMCERFVLQKLKPYYDMMGWSSQRLLNTYLGLGHLSWV